MELSVFAGVDWASEKQDVCVIDREGVVLGERVFGRDPDGLSAMSTWLASYGPPDATGVAIELPRGAVVDVLIEAGLPVFSINPKQLDRFRDRFTVCKDDQVDARTLADSLRTDRRAYRLVDLDDPQVIALRELLHLHDELTTERGRLANRLWALLERYYHQALLFGRESATALWFLEMLRRFPRPADAQGKQCKRVVKRILNKYRVRRFDADQVVDILRGPSFSLAEGTVEAVSSRVELLIDRLCLAITQCRTTDQRIRALLKEMGSADDEDRAGQPRDVDIILSFPGIGHTVAATLLAEASHVLGRRDYQGLRTLTGVAPVSRLTGKRRGRSGRVAMRRARHLRLANAVHHWVGAAVSCDPFWRAQARQAKQRGQGLARRHRGLADRMLRILVSMLRSGERYDPVRISRTARTIPASTGG